MSAKVEEILTALSNFCQSHPEILEYGIAPAAPTPSADKLRAWVHEGLHAGLAYMETHLELRANPKLLEPWAESLILIALRPPTPLQKSPARYGVAAYAQGEDYHHRARRTLSALQTHLESVSPDPLRLRPFVDSAPLFERDLAAEAGLGWRGKNTTLIHRKWGSHFLLCGLMIDIQLPRHQPVQEFCGGCTLCLDQCPTSAFVAPGKLDANRCISYWTIEHKGEIPSAMAEKLSGWIFGCDICQTVCPWNHKHLSTASLPDFNLPAENWLLLLRKGGGFQSRFRGSPLMRAGRKALLRNLAIALRYRRETQTLPLLQTLVEAEDSGVVKTEILKTIESLSQG